MKKILVILLFFAFVLVSKADDWVVVDDCKNDINPSNSIDFLSAIDCLGEDKILFAVECVDGFSSTELYHKSIRFTSDLGKTFDTLWDKAGMSYSYTGKSPYPRISRVKIFDSNTFFAMDQWCNLHKTTDAGKNWDSLNVGFQSTFTGEQYTEKVEFKMYENGSGIMIYGNLVMPKFFTTDLGKTWDVLDTPKKTVYNGDSLAYSIISADIKGDTIITTSEYELRSSLGTSEYIHKFYHSYDLGETWKEIDGITYPDNDTLYAIKKTQIKILKNGDLLLLGSRVNYLDPDLAVFDPAFNDDGSLSIAVPPRIYKSYDFGKTWVLKYTTELPTIVNSASDRYDVYQDSMIVYITEDRILLSRDFGETWNTIRPNQIMRAVSIIDENRLLMKTSEDLQIYNMATNSVEREFVRTALYPNPVREGQTLNMEVEKAIGIANIKIYDVAGKIVSATDAVNLYSNHNKLEYKIDSNFTPGVYFVVVESNGIVYVNEKFIVE